MLFVLMKEQIAYSRDLATVQATIDPDAGVKKFEAYRKMAFPWVEEAQEKEHEVQLARLKAFVDEGPLAVRPIHAQNTFKSQMVRRIEVAKPLPAEVRKKHNELYTRLKKSKE